MAAACESSSELLLLFLGIHPQYQAPNPYSLDYLTIHDFGKLKCLSKSLHQRLLQNGIEYTKCHDGKNYMVPFPGYPGLLNTRDDRENAAALFPHQLASLRMMYRLENPSNVNTFGALRGGILGDAPGLGKTIEVLALIASTAGMYPLRPSISLNATNIADGWSSLCNNPVYQQDLSRVLKPVRVWAEENKYENPVAFQTVNDLIRELQIPLDADRFSTASNFMRHVQNTLYGIVPQAELELASQKFEVFQIRLDKDQRSFFASSRGRRFLLERSLIPSRATLIVVPDALLEHWFEQPLQHLLLQQFVERSSLENEEEEEEEETPRGLIYLDGIGDIADASAPLERVDLKREIAPAVELMRYLIVVTTFSRCEGEYRREQWAGRLKELEKNDGGKGRKRTRQSVLSSGTEDAGIKPPVSPLLQIRWLRLIVDEGHELGAHNASELGLTHILHEVAAERRWVLSGTPTTGDEDSDRYTADCLNQLQRLLCFLRHPLYGAVQPQRSLMTRADLERQKYAARGKWEAAVKTPFLERKMSGREELLRVLRGVMVMHQKKDIVLPRPKFLQGEVTVPVPIPEQQKVIQATSPLEAKRLLDEYLGSDGYQSLVDEAQAAYIFQSIQEARKKREEIVGTISEENVTETDVDIRPVKAVVYSSSNKDLLSVMEQLYKRLRYENIAEMHGEISSMSSELSRFRNDSKKVIECPVCSGVNEIAGSRSRCERVLMEVTEVDGLRRRLLIEPERVVRAPQPPLGNVGDDRLGDIPRSDYGQARKKWKIGDILEVDIRDPHPVLSARESAETWDQWGSLHCRELAFDDGYTGHDWFFGPLACEEENREVVQVCLQKWQPCWEFHKPNRWYEGPRFSDSPVKIIQEDVFVLCLYSEVSHGLDLSFVTHIYLLEPIDDAALLQQVTSRAHRLGATGSVTVETVNVWLDIDSKTKNAISLPATSRDASSGRSLQKEHQTEKATCEFCCRSFKSLAEAEEHERTNCPHNPECPTKTDDFHLSSLYREIRPPEPCTMMSEARIAISD